MAEKLSSAQVSELFSRGVAEVVGDDHLRQRLLRGDTLRLKLGIDPTGEKLHLGHAVPLRILRRYQNFGHTVVLIIGDTTATIGDPSGRTETRPAMTKQEIAKNLATYERQALKILDRKKIEFRWQSEWYGKFGISEIIQEASKLSAGWILSHETFRSRMKEGQPLALHELLYPLLQAYDSVAVKADVEFGALDQKFNNLTGRELMKAHGFEPQDVVLTKYLVGTDGQKMGKSLNNFIALEEEPFEMFGKIMSMPDTVLRDYFELATDVPTSEITKMKFEGTAARDSKLRLAREIVGLYHGTKASQAAADKWHKFSEGVVESSPVKISAIPSGTLLEAFAVFRWTKSKSEAQRLIKQGGVRVNNRKVTDPFHKLAKGDTITFGKKKTTRTLT